MWDLCVPGPGPGPSTEQVLGNNQPSIGMEALLAPALWVLMALFRGWAVGPWEPWPCLGPCCPCPAQSALPKTRGLPAGSIDLFFANYYLTF